MSAPEAVLTHLREAVALGGPVIALLLGLSVVVVAVALFKLWHFAVLRVGRPGAISRALQATDAGQPDAAATFLACRAA